MERGSAENAVCIYFDKLTSSQEMLVKLKEKGLTCENEEQIYCRCPENSAGFELLFTCKCQMAAGVDSF